MNGGSMLSPRRMRCQASIHTLTTPVYVSLQVVCHVVIQHLTFITLTPQVLMSNGMYTYVRNE